MLRVQPLVNHHLSSSPPAHHEKHLQRVGVQGQVQSGHHQLHQLCPHSGHGQLLWRCHCFTLLHCIHVVSEGGWLGCAATLDHEISQGASHFLKRKVTKIHGGLQNRAEGHVHGNHGNSCKGFRKPFCLCGFYYCFCAFLTG